MLFPNHSLMTSNYRPIWRLIIQVESNVITLKLLTLSPMQLLILFYSIVIHRHILITLDTNGASDIRTHCLLLSYCAAVFVSWSVCEICYFLFVK